MGKWEKKKIGELNEYRSVTIDPQQYPDEIFELYSVPSWDNQYPEILSGSCICSTKQIVQKGDVLICKINPRINRVWVVSQFTKLRMIASSEWIIIRNDSINSQYLMKYFESPQFRNLLVLEQAGIGGSLTRAQPKRVKEYTVPIPDVATQTSIAQTLQKMHCAIQARKAQIDNLDLLIKSQFVQLFGDPVINSKEWKLEALSNLGELNRGVSKHRPRNDPKLLGGPYPLIQTGDISNSGLYLNEYHSTYSEIGLHQSKIWPLGTLCITIAANIAKTSILAMDACFPDSVVGFTSNAKTNNIFMHHWFSFFQQILEAQAPESAQKNINLRILSELQVICPLIELQNQFADFVQQVEPQKALLQQSLAKMEQTYKSLMQKCFRGEIFN